MDHMPRAQPHPFIDRRLAPDRHRNPLQQQQQQQPQPQSSVVVAPAPEAQYCDVTYQQPFGPMLRLEAGQHFSQQQPIQFPSSMTMHQQRHTMVQQPPGFQHHQRNHHIHQHQPTIHHENQPGTRLASEQLPAEGYEQQPTVAQESTVIYETYESRQPPTQNTGLPEAGDSSADQHIYSQQQLYHHHQQQQQQQQLQMQQVHQSMTSADAEQLAGYEGQSYAMVDNRAGYVQQDTSMMGPNQFSSVSNEMLLSSANEQHYETQPYGYEEPADDYGIDQSDEGLGGGPICQAPMQQQTLVQARSGAYQAQISIQSQNQAYYEPEQMDVQPTIKQQHQQLMMRRRQMLPVGLATNQIVSHIHRPLNEPYQQQSIYHLAPDQQHVKGPPIGKVSQGQSHEFGRLAHRYQQHQPPSAYLSPDQKTHSGSEQQQTQTFAELDGPKQVVKHKNLELVELQANGAVPSDRLDTICRHLIEHMNRFGICVIDNFLGALKGESILNEVKKLYSRGQYSRGRLVSNKMSLSSTAASSTSSSPVSSSSPSSQSGASSSPAALSSASGSTGASPSRAQPSDGCLVDEIAAIRNDRVIWIDGYEDGCCEINSLIQILCSVITNSARLSLYSNNALDKVVINKRTKAHVACYPGNGTRYIKHVDNPNGDGRLITSIYYLNKDWNAKRDGGLLRMFPVGMDQVANIEPLFDRVLFFWSDRRNPHEVLPAYKDRFAITVWYIGETRA